MSLVGWRMKLRSIDKSKYYQLYTYGGYEYVSSLSEQEAQDLLKAILDETYTANKIYKDNKNCFIVNFDTTAHSGLMLKIPKERNRRKWERFLTLFRPNEAFRNYDSMMTLKRHAIRGTVPLLAAHKKERGMSVESFLIYEFIDGIPATKEHLSAVLSELKKLHDAGYVRSDPKLDNFLIKDGEAFFIDFRLNKPTLFPRFQCMMNLCKFLRTLSEDKTFLQKHFAGNRLVQLSYYVQSGLCYSRYYSKKIKHFLRGSKS